MNITDILFYIFIVCDNKMIVISKIQFRGHQSKSITRFYLCFVVKLLHRTIGNKKPSVTFIVIQI